ncbi:hypothetical protein F5X96DRAFT_479216 [Biscogniauxia mediterranea]|nr:hypothetical protein F5X96DRAFT_479216 [Biscogniauxia mediterranea]
MQPKIPDKLRYRGFHAHHPTYLSPSRFLSHRAAFLSFSFSFFFPFPGSFSEPVSNLRVSSRRGLGLLLPIIISVVIKLELKNHDAFSNSSISRILCKHTVNIITIKRKTEREMCTLLCFNVLHMYTEFITHGSSETISVHAKLLLPPQGSSKFAQH